MARRLYNIYAVSRGLGFTSKSIRYSHDTHRIRYTVRAVSIRQAYWLAANEQWATDAKGNGILESYSGRKHDVTATWRDYAKEEMK
jgi:hypothetical protein